MLTGPEARGCAEALRLEIRVLRSMLQEAYDERAWEACGFDSATEWIADIFDGEMTLPLVGNLAAIHGRQVAASVSRPGNGADVRPRPTEVTTFFKGGGRR